MSEHSRLRRLFIQSAGLIGAGMVASKAQAHHTESHFDEKSAHQLVYQCNHAGNDYIGHVLFSCGEMLRKYGDDIELVVTTFGPGVQLLGKNPTRPIAQEHRDRAKSLAAYGVAFHACGNTMKSLKWKDEDIVEFASIVPIGAVDLMELQEKGFSYISW